MMDDAGTADDLATWIPVDADDAKVLAQVVEVDGRWTVTGVLVTANHIDSRVLKAIAPAVTGVVGGLNAIPEMQDYARGHHPDPVIELNAAVAAAVDELRGPPPAKARKRRAPLTRPDGKDPDQFYRRVAQAFGDAEAVRQSPALAIATEAGVPLATARGWIREARRRGALAPGRRRAGPS